MARSQGGEAVQNVITGQEATPSSTDRVTSGVIPGLAALAGAALLVVQMICGMPAIADSSDPAHVAYKAAIAAIKKNNSGAVEKHLKTLEHHPLRAFVEYEQLKRKTGSLSAEQVERFVNENRHAVVSKLLHQRYLSILIKRKAWRQVVEQSKGLSLSTETGCHVLRARLNTGVSASDLDDDILKLWLHGKSQPDACDPIFSAWDKAGLLSDERVVDRIELAMHAGRPKLARWLTKKYLKSSSHRWIERWIAVRARPAKTLAAAKWSRDDSVFAPRIIVHGIQRAARKNLDSANDVVQRFAEKFSITDAERSRIARSVGMKAAVDHHASASEWLARVSDEDADKTNRAWRIRAALREGNYARAREFLAMLPQEERDEKKWRYWHARMVEQAGDKETAQAIYTELAATRNFYGFLSADRLGLSYEMNSEQLPGTAADSIVSREDLVMARELMVLGEKRMARRQWRYATLRMPPEDMRLAALAAHRWGWHDRAIITAGKSGYLNDIEVRFPLLYTDQVNTNASRNGIDPAWVYGVMRQESAFMVDARSGVGALGLMQLMPATGRRMGRKLKLRVRSNSTILQPKTNIQLGTAYLRTVLDKNQQNTVLATASYNAGPHKVKNWLPSDGVMDADIWIETIPYSETRNFVKNVLAFTAVYIHRLGGDHRPLKNNMPAITSPAT